MALLIKSYSASLPSRRIPARYPSLAGIIFWPPSLGRAPKYFCNKIGTEQPRANVRFPSHRWKIRKPGEGNRAEDIVVRIKADAPVLKPDEPVPAQPVL